MPPFGRDSVLFNLIVASEIVIDENYSSFDECIFDDVVEACWLLVIFKSDIVGCVRLFAVQTRHTDCICLCL